jgi:spermidine synthase
MLGSFLFSIAFFVVAFSQSLLAEEHKRVSYSSRYNNIVIENTDGFTTLFFTVNHKLFLETKYNFQTPKVLPVEYVRYMTLGLAYAGKVETVLLLGLGGGSLLTYLRQYLRGLYSDSVEIDPEVVKVSQKYFGFEKSSRSLIVEMDAVKFIESNQKKYDIIFSDTYKGGGMSSALLHDSYFKQLSRSLTRTGCLVSNLHKGEIFDRALKAIRGSFLFVSVYKTTVNDNYIVIAYNHSIRPSEVLQRAIQLQEKYQFNYDLTHLLKNTITKEK